MIAIAEATGTRDDRDLVEDVVGWYRQRGAQPDERVVTSGMNELADEWNARWSGQV